MSSLQARAGLGIQVEWSGAPFRPDPSGWYRDTTQLIGMCLGDDAEDPDAGGGTRIGSRRATWRGIAALHVTGGGAPLLSGWGVLQVWPSEGGEPTAFRCGLPDGLAESVLARLGARALAGRGVDCERVTAREAQARLVTLVTEIGESPGGEIARALSARVAGASGDDSGW